MQIIKHTTLDVAAQNTIQPIVAKQYDSGSRFITAQLTNEGEEIFVSPSSVVLINASREDKAAQAFAGTVNEDGTITVPITRWMLELDGMVTCDVTVIDSEQRKLSTTSFEIMVEPASYNGEDVSEDDYDLLTNLIAECIRATEAAWAAASGSIGAKISTITLAADNWAGEASPYSQTVTINGSTEFSKIDINPSVEQLAIFHEKDIEFVVENEDGVLTAYCIGQKPMNDYTMQITITEVLNDG